VGLISTKEYEPITCCHVIIFISTQQKTLASIFTMFPSPNHRQPWISSAAPAPITAATRALEPFSLPLFRNNNILLTLALHGPTKHRESRTIRSPPLMPPQATKMCASDPLPREHTASNTSNLQLHQLSNALLTPRNETRRICSSKHETTTFMHHEITMLVGKEMSNHYTSTTTQQQHRSHICSTRRKLAPSQPRRRRRRSITQQPHCSIAPAKTQIFEREGVATCHPVIAQSKWSKLVKYLNLVKDWSNKRG